MARQLISGPEACERLFLAVVGPNATEQDLARMRVAWAKKTEVWREREIRRRARRENRRA